MQSLEDLRQRSRMVVLGLVAEAAGAPSDGQHQQHAHQDAGDLASHEQTANEDLADGASMECRILGPEMNRLGYDRGWSAAIRVDIRQET